MEPLSKCSILSRAHVVYKRTGLRVCPFAIYPIGVILMEKTKNESAFILLTANTQNLRNAAECLAENKFYRKRNELNEILRLKMPLKRLAKSLNEGEFKTLLKSPKARLRHVNVSTEHAIVTYAVTKTIDNYISLFHISLDRNESGKEALGAFYISESSISRYLKRFDYQVLVNVLERRITDKEFLALVRSLMIEEEFVRLDLDEEKGSPLVRLLYHMLLDDVQRIIDLGGGQILSDELGKWSAYFESRETARNAFFEIFIYLREIGLAITINQNDEIVQEDVLRREKLRTSLDEEPKVFSPEGTKEDLIKIHKDNEDDEDDPEYAWLTKDLDFDEELDDYEYDPDAYEWLDDDCDFDEKWDDGGVLMKQVLDELKEHKKLQGAIVRAIDLILKIMDDKGLI